MRKLSFSAVLSPALLLLAACGGTTLTVDLVAANNSGQSGTVKLYDKGSDSELAIETVGGTDTNDQLAFLKLGACSNDGTPAGGTASVLTTVHEGQSDTTVTGRKLADLEGGRYHVEIQNSANPNLLNSCGNIP